MRVSHPSSTNPGPPDAPMVAVSSRRTPLSARGEPAVWLLGLALCLCVTLVVALMALIAREGSKTFWPRPIDEVTLVGGEKMLGVPVQDEAFDAAGDEAAMIAARRGSPDLIEGAFDKDGRAVRRLYRVGNRDVGQEPFRWVTLAQVDSIERPPAAVMLERQEWGVWIGIPRAIFRQARVKVPASAGEFKAAEIIDTDAGPRAVERTLLSTESDGTRVVRQRMILLGAPAPKDGVRFPSREAWTLLDSLHEEATDRAARIKAIEKYDIGAINHDMESWRLRVREAEMERDRSALDRREPTPAASWAGGVACVIALAAGFFALGRRGAARTPAARMIRPALLVLAGVISLWCGLESPWSRRAFTDADVATVKAEADAALGELQKAYDEALARIAELRTLDEQFRVEIVDAKGRFAPVRQTAPDEPLMLSQVVRVVRPNELGLAGKLGVYLSRW
ncbi:MAG: hypothetical protein JNL50_10225, partial [Phycisphaerae bacterium]|nr:hypothetical protein [Phycisphaerae bacterium]